MAIFIINNTEIGSWAKRPWKRISPKRSKAKLWVQITTFYGKGKYILGLKILGDGSHACLVSTSKPKALATFLTTSCHRMRQYYTVGNKNIPLNISS